VAEGGFKGAWVASVVRVRGVVYRPRPVTDPGAARVWCVGAALALVLWVSWQAAPAAGQVADFVRQEELEVYRGRPVAAVEVLRRAEEEGGEPGALSEEASRLARNQLRVSEGQAFDPEVAMGDVRNLNRLGRFASIEVSVVLLEDGSVAVRYLVEERPIIMDVQAVGNTRISDREIRDVVGLLAGTPVDPLRLQRAARDIELLYRGKGFHDVRVTVDEEELEENGIVLFQIEEHDRLRVKEIRFRGNRSISSRRLGADISTSEAWLFNRGIVDEERLAEDVARIRDLYLNRGYLDVRVSRRITRSPDNREAIVTFDIDEGRVYTVREVKAFYPQYEKGEVYATRSEAEAAAGPNEGVHPGGPGEYRVFEYGRFTPEQLAGLVPIKSGDVYSRRELRGAIGAVEEAYGKLGHLTDWRRFGMEEAVRVEVQAMRDPTRPEVDLLLVIWEAPSYLAGELIISGNDLTKQKVILRELDQKPNRPLDGTALESSRRNLVNSQLFDRQGIRLTPQEPDPREPEYRDVLVEVQETNTARLNIGGLVDADLGVSGQLVYEQNNFDIADPPRSFEELITNKAFRGAGQSFSIRLQPGTVQQLYSVSFSEPHLFDSDYSLGTSVFYRTFAVDEYTEERLGGSVSFGRRFGRQWRISLGLSADNVELSDIDENAAVDIFDSAEQSNLFGVSLAGTRTSTDSFSRPTEGSRLRLGGEVVGGDWDFVRFTADYKRYFTIAEDVLGRRTVLSVDLRAGYIPQDEDEVPVYERFYLGGRNFRGFGFREVSPRSVDRNGDPAIDPVGGTWSFFAGVEVEQSVYQEILAVVGFVDTGTVLQEFGFEDYRVSVGVGLRLYLPISPIPLALDFGFPIVKEDTDEERIFSFTFDVPF